MLDETYIGHRADTGEAVAFPVQWPDGASARRTWRWDAEHSPFPLTPLSQEFSRGMGGPSIVLQSPGGGGPPPTPGPAANGYRYVEAGGGAFGLGSGAYRDDIAAMAPRVEELWDRGWRLEIEAMAAEIAGADYDSLSLPDLVQRLESLTGRVRENMVLMFRAGHLVSFSRGELVDFCAAHIGVAAESLVTDLLRGTPSDSLDSGAALWDVAQLLTRNPALFHRLDAQPDGQGLASLAELEGGAEFIAKFADWLDRYGHRNGSFSELAEPSWHEEPRLAIGLMLQYVRAEDPRQSQKAAIVVREKVQREFEARLAQPRLIAAFRAFLAAAGPYLGVRESRDHATNMAFTAIRVPALAIGSRLVARGAIADAADVFFLQFADLEAAAAATGRNAAAKPVLSQVEGAATDEADLRSLVAGRRESYAYWRNVVPPPAIGDSKERDPEPKLIRGIAANAGEVTGRARVLISLDEANSLQPGEILVTRGTTPAWTLLFATAAAVVTEGGGVLSHCAIVAREYGIPAVVGASGASARIRDGDTITVDGTRGRVTIH